MAKNDKHLGRYTQTISGPQFPTGARPPSEDSSNSQGSARTPWNKAGGGVSPSQSVFFSPIELRGERWNQLFPYRLLVVDASNGYSIVGGSSGEKVQLSTSAGAQVLSFESMGNKWAFSLPITPQQLSISSAYAITTIPTLRGITEEHGGTRFKMISCAGTMGVWPSRKNLNSPPKSPDALQTLFGGTIEAASSLTNQVNRTINSITQGHPAGKKSDLAPPKGYEVESTGYYQTLLLDQFLEQYAEAKRDPNNRHWRLVFDIPKENQSYLVTPIQYTYSKSVDSPNEYRYNLQLKAWKRITINDKAISTTFGDLTLTPNIIQRLITATEEARRTVGSAYNLIKAVRSDFQTPFNILREISLFTKDLAGIPAAIVDLPRQIIQDAGSAIKDSMKNLSSAGTDLSGASSGSGSGSAAGGVSSALLTSFLAVKNSSSNREGVSDSAVFSGQLGDSMAYSAQTDSSNQILANPEQNFDLFNSVQISDVNFSFAQQERIDQDLETIRETTVDDLIQKRAALLELALQISNNFGAGDADYDKIYGRPAPYDRIQEMTIDEFDILRKIYDAIQALDSITATNEVDQDRTESAFEYVGSLAQESEIPFDDTSQTKVRVPVPFGLNMEQISARYLGDPDKWLEIATLNALRSPYIDEDGFFYDLLSNADGRQFNVETNENLFIGQKIVLSSLTQPSTTRRIINIEKISPTNYLITADGLDNLDVFTTGDNAKMRAYLPGTVNSQDQIYVPSNLPATDTVLSRPVPATKGDPLVGLSKIDWLLTDSGDLATDAFGDFRLAFGMSNIMQALKMKFATPPSVLLKHPDFGAGLTPGISTADLNDQDVIRQIIRTIEQDSRFGEIVNLSIERKGPTYSIFVSVTLADGSGVFPISFVLNK